MMASDVALGVIVFALVLFLYAYFGYPAMLWVVGIVRRQPDLPDGEPDVWPVVSVTVPAYNEEDQIRELIKSLLALDYPRDRLQILIVSDASTDGTDDIVREYEDRGVELLRMPTRGGKTRAENAAAEVLRGEIVVNTDASIRIARPALKELVRVFRDPGVGCASGRDVSVGPGDEMGNVGESGYVGYEMRIRDLETRVSGIIGSSGCFYAIRPELHRLPLPVSLSRDFASALHTREHGYRTVSVPEAVCHVPRTTSLKKEYRRKVRTITRGMETLWHKRALLDPFRYGAFSWMLFSHKVCRWMLPPVGIAALVALVTLASRNTVALGLVMVAAVVLTLAAVGWRLSERSSVPRVFSIPAFLVAGNLAAAHALVRALSGDRDALWEPTRREVVKAGES